MYWFAFIGVGSLSFFPNFSIHSNGFWLPWEVERCILCFSCWFYWFFYFYMYFLFIYIIKHFIHLNRLNSFTNNCFWYYIKKSWKIFFFFFNFWIIVEYFYNTIQIFTAYTYFSKALLFPPCNCLIIMQSGDNVKIYQC